MHRAYFTDYAVAMRVAAAARDMGYDVTTSKARIGAGWKVVW